MRVSPPPPTAWAKEVIPFTLKIITRSFKALWYVPITARLIPRVVTSWRSDPRSVRLIDRLSIIIPAPHSKGPRAGKYALFMANARVDSLSQPNATSLNPPAGEVCLVRFGTACRCFFTTLLGRYRARRAVPTAKTGNRLVLPRRTIKVPDLGS